MKLVYTILCLFLAPYFYGQLSGTFTIGGSTPDYNTINAAILDLNSSGVSGPVVFNIRDGVYNEQFVIKEIVGTSSINTVTIQSENQDSALVVIEFEGASATENYIVKLDSADYISIKHLTLNRGVGTNWGNQVIIFENGANHNELAYTRCISGAPTYTNESNTIVSPSSSDNYNHIHHNAFVGGMTGVKVRGDASTGLDTSWVIENNNFDGYYGVDLEYMYAPIVNENILDCFGTNATLPVLNFENCEGGLKCTKNYFNTYYGSAKFYFCSATSSDSVWVANNMGISGTNFTFNMSSLQNAYCFHNTLITRSLSSSGAAFIIQNSDAIVKNNIFINEGFGYGMHLASGTVVTDYNNIYSNGVLVRKGTAQYNNLSDWQASTGSPGVHSSSHDIQFLSSTDLHVYSNIDLKGTGENLGVTEDIDNELRATNPDLGADEFALTDNDAGVVVIPMDSSLCAGVHNMMIRFRNFGGQGISNLNLNWEVNGVIQPPFAWSGNVSSGDTSNQISIGTINILQDTIYDIKVWPTLPNGIADTINQNDTITTQLITKMSGHYLVRGATPYFNSITESLDALIARGICDSVFIDITPGLYNESLVIPKIPGTSPTAWVVFQSEDLDSSSVTIYRNVSSSGPDEIIALDATEYIMFRSIGIKRTNSSGFNYNLISSINSSHNKHIVFDGCLLTTDKKFSGTALTLGEVDNLILSNTHIENTSYGAAIDQSLCSTCDSIRIEDNVFQNIRNKSLSVIEYDSVRIRGNYFFNDTITLLDGQAHSTEGIYFYQSNGSSELSYNQFDGRYSPAIFVGSSNGNAGNQIKVHHNMVSCHNVGSADTYGLTIAGSSNLEVAHNNIRLINTPWSGYGNLTKGALYIYSNTNIDVVNNNFYSEGEYIYYFSNSGGPWNNNFDEFDYNNHFTPSGSITQTCFGCGGWPSVFNANSINVDPIYTSNSDLHVTNLLLDGAGTDYGYVYDIDHEWINVPPTIGADEIESFDRNVKPINLSTIHHGCDSIIVQFQLVQNGLNNITSIDINVANQGVQANAFTWTGSLNYLDTSAVVSVTLTSIPDVANTVFVLTENPNGLPDQEPENDSVGISLNYESPNAVINGLNVVCPGDYIVLSSGGIHHQYQWNTGATTPELVVNLSDTYSIVVQNEIGCKDSVAVFVDTCSTPYNDALPIGHCFFDQQYHQDQLHSNVWLLEHANEDLNGDGLVDQVEVTLNGEVYVRLNSGSNFSLSGAFSTNNNPVDLLVVDVNNDSHLDIIVLGGYGECQVLTNDGVGGFTLQSYTVTTGAQSLAVADINNDNFNDVIYCLPSNDELEYMLSSPIGLGSPITLPIGTVEPIQIVSHDYNGDGVDDLAVCSDHTVATNGLQVYYGDGAGNFVLNQMFLGVHGGIYITKGDVNNDGYLDLVYNAGGGFFGTLLSDINGDFIEGPTFLQQYTNGTGGWNYGGILCEDANGDGLDDVIATNFDHNSFTFYKGVANEMPQNRQVFQTGNYPISAGIGDYNGDGHLDIITSNRDYTYQYFLGATDGSIEGIEHLEVPYSSNSSKMTSADFDNDGDVDMMVSTSNPDALIHFRNNSAGHFYVVDSIPLNNPTTCMISQDINNDGYPDVIIGEEDVVIYLNQGNGTFAVNQVINYLSYTVNILHLMDMDGDGIDDMVIIQNDQLEYYKGSATGTFTYQSTGPTLNLYMGDIQHNDFNFDGNMDFVLASGTDDLHMFINQGNFTFSLTTYVPSLYEDIDVLDLSDVNGDGIVDVVIGIEHEVLFMLADSLGNLTLSSNVYGVPGVNILDLEMVDFTGDGLEDIAITSYSVSGLVLWRRLSGFGFTQVHESVLGKYSNTLNTFDYDGDGDKDFAVLNASSNRVSINWNLSPEVYYDDPVDSICYLAAPFNLSGGVPAGGYYMIDGVVETSFDPAVHGFGPHVVTYYYNDPNSCLSLDMDTIVVTGEVFYEEPMDSVCLIGNPFILSGGFPTGGLYYLNGNPILIFNPSTHGLGTHVITYVYTDPNSCVSTATDSILVTTLNVYYDDPIDTICQSDAAVNFSGGIPAGGVYYVDGNITPTPIFDPSLFSVGTHHITYEYTSQNFCVTSVIDSIEVLSVNNSVSIIGDTLIASQSNASYQWIDCNSGLPIPNETNPYFVMQNTGSYAVIVDNGHCVDTSGCYNYTDVGSTLASRIIVHPNPNKGVFTVQTKDVGEIFSVEVRDAVGKIVFKENGHKQALEVNINEQARGTYFVTIATEQGEITKRIIKL